ncbi:MAG: YggT family protein [Gammaproteobacteria bacterium]|nr:YggT family protein [Gammaproteobacteria bacterium]
MGQNFANAGVFLIQTFLGLYILVIMLRFLMQAVRADFYNPISQGIVKLTDPALRPLRRVIPGIWRFDLACLVLALVIQIIALILVYLLYGAPVPNPLALAVWSVVGLFSLTLKIYYFSLIAMIIVSWIAPNSNHPAILLIHQIVEPICVPARKLLPPMGGLDFSVILVFVFITLIDSFLVIKPLQVFLGIPSGVIFGL